MLIATSNFGVLRRPLESANSASITVPDGGTVYNESITDSGNIASIVGEGSFTLNQVRINSEEGVRIGGSGDIVINNSYIETTGIGADHADGIQAYSPGDSGNLTITNTTIVSHDTAANAGLFIADNYGGTVTLDNVVFEGGPIALRIAADNQDITVALKDVYFVGPFMYEPLLIQEVNANIHITEWDNVRYATIVNGQLVPGDLIPSPFPVEGGASTTPTVNVTAPDITSWSPDSGKVGDGVTNADKIVLKGTAAAGATISVLDGTTQVGTAKADSSGAWSVTTSTLSNANHTLVATATDSSGHTSAASTAVNVTVDTVAPATPVETAYSVVNTNHVQMTGTAEANSTITLYEGTTVVGTGTTNANGIWSVTTSALSTGSHILNGTATDAAGNVSVMSAPLDPVIGTTTGSSTTGSSAPSSSTTAPAAPVITSFSTDSGVVGDHITSDNTLTLKGTAAANSTVNVFDGATQVGTATVNSKGHWSLTTPVLKDGAHNLTATDVDSSGHASAASTALSVTIDTHAPQAPTEALFSQTGGAVGATSGLNDFILKGTAEANSTVKVFDGSTQIGTATADTKGAWSLDTGHLADGGHSFVSTATDVAGNTSAASAAQNVNVATSVSSGASVPSAPSTSSAPIEFTSLTENSSHIATIKGTADAYSQIKLYDGNSTVGSTTAAADGTWTVTTGSLSNTVHTFTAAEVNSSGKVIGTSAGSAILGSSASDVMTSTGGDDVFVGNGSLDTFNFKAGFGNAVILDNGISDHFEFSSSQFANFASVLSHAAQVGNDTVITLGHDTLTMKNTPLSGLQSSDFHFS